LTTDFNSTFENNSSIDLIGSKMAEACANSVYKKSGLGPKDIQVVELHDCFSANELCTYEAIGLCEVGKAGEAIDNNDFTYGGKR
jgi:acetyl-CoA acetyltransferase